MAAGTIVETSWRLVRRHTVPVPFHGRTDRDGPLTLGQLNILRWMTAGDEPIYATIGCAVDLPEKAGVTDVAKSVAVLLARHEGLRTVFDLDDPPRQHVLGSGVLPLDVYTVAAEPAVPVDPAAL
ncbi:MAG: hypothetical protein IRY92_05475, partial [Dactylosporangium sp.]|nr:hypothetical protein [Dactylosporangium sp.]